MCALFLMMRNYLECATPTLFSRVSYLLRIRGDNMPDISESRKMGGRFFVRRENVPRAGESATDRVNR